MHEAFILCVYMGYRTPAKGLYTEGKASSKVSSMQCVDVKLSYV